MCRAITPRLKVTANGTYLSSKVTRDYVTGDPIGNSVNIHGESLPNTPKVQLSGGPEYDFPLSDRLSAFAGATVTYHSSTYSLFGENKTFQLPSYTLLDLRAGISSEAGWTLEVFGHNVTNTYYLTDAAVGTDALLRYAGFPVTYGARFSVKFR